MLWNEVVELGVASETVIDGEPIKSLTWETVYADKQSIRYKEFYEGNNLGLKPELLFVVRSIDYNKHEKIRYDGTIYDIMRTYVNGDVTELTVTSFTGD